MPKIEVPRTESAPMRDFRLPSEVSGPVSSKPEAAGGAAEAAAAERPATAESDAPATGKRRRSRPSTGRFRDRTLNWFKTGDEIDGDEPIEGDYDEHGSGPPVVLIAGVAAGALCAIALLLWALL